jgi:hypothetical protein
VLALVLAAVARYRAGKEEDAVAIPRAPASVVKHEAEHQRVDDADGRDFRRRRDALHHRGADEERQFTAGILPALVLALVLAAVARYRAGKEEDAVAIPLLALEPAAIDHEAEHQRVDDADGRDFRRRRDALHHFIVGAASAMAWALTQSGFSHDLARAMAAVPGGKTLSPPR